MREKGRGEWEGFVSFRTRRWVEGWERGASLNVSFVTTVWGVGALLQRTGKGVVRRQQPHWPLHSQTLSREGGRG